MICPTLITTLIILKYPARYLTSICKTCKNVDLDKAFDLFQTVNLSWRVIVILSCKQLYFWSETNDVYKKK